MNRIVPFTFLLILMILPLRAQDGSAGSCLTCHKEKTTGIYNQWAASKHAQNEVTCLECHWAEKSDKDAFEHHGALVASIVTPYDCGQCHEQEMREVTESYHAEAGKILDSNDAYLAHTAGGDPASIQGCESCHGAKVVIDDNAKNKLSAKTWPNFGVGRINPDGSLGSCSACHNRHIFSKAMARQPESCSKCHLGPDHPQKEIYEESKHGNSYFTQKEMMNLKSDRWVVGQDYFAAPTCATCHMSATPAQAFTHDVGARISWTLRPIISVKKENWQEKRANMIEVCSHCHSKSIPDNHYYQFDATVNLYNEKFAKPATDIMQMIRDNNLLENKAAFSNKVEWTYWELWHHEGRRARHGASMMGPDYTWWHGIYDVAQHFYFKFLPEALEYDDPEINAYIENMLANNDMHNWINRSTGDLKKMIKSGELQQRYHHLFE